MRKQSNHRKGTFEVKHDNIVAPLASKTVNIAKLKDFVARNFPPGSPLQVIFVDEDDELSAEDFLAKLPIWLKLSKFTKCQDRNPANWKNTEGRPPSGTE
jgi:hypothetical protein